MSNVKVREKTVKFVEVVVPNPATARDVSDLIRVADERVKTVNPKLAQFDDAYTVEARDDEIVAIIEVGE